MWSDSFFHVNPFGPLTYDIAQGGVAQLLLGLPAVGVFSRLKEKIILADLTLNPIHPRDILINIMSSCRMDRNLVHFLALIQIIEKPNALLSFEVR